MTEPHGAGEHHDPITVQAYLVIFGALSVFTLVSFIVNHFFPPPDMTGLIIIMSVAVCKATLVVMYFMHVKIDWPKLYFIMVPVVILAVMMMIVLMPDGVVGWHTAAAEEAAADKPAEKGK
jgi:caa(3)-type oxidase subunit IV